MERGEGAQGPSNVPAPLRFLRGTLAFISPPSNPSSCCFIISDASTMTSKFTVHGGVVHSGLTSVALLVMETKGGRF